METTFRVVGLIVAMVAMALFLSVVISALLIGGEKLVRWIARKRNGSGKQSPTLSTSSPENLSVNNPAAEADDIPDPARRLALGKIAAGIPIVTLGLAGVGMAESYRPIPIREEQLIVPGLPSALEGLRLWHLSDAHLYHYVRVKDIESLAAAIAPMKPDLIAITGDLADDLNQLGPALEILHGIPTTLGIYATLGNHEYFRGIRQVLKTYDASPVPLLVNESVSLTYGGERFRIAGIDDPQTMRAYVGDFYERSVGQAVADDTLPTILLSHRPNVFTESTRRKIMLTLAGHTHGGQMGIAGRSIFEAPGRYLWGYYTNDNAALYTSCGAGHWFPFRLGCPQEAPLFVLTSGKKSAFSSERESRGELIRS